MAPEALVRAFYADIWNSHDRAPAERLLAADFVFRGSLGSERRGIPDFLAYVDEVHAALEGFRCEIDDLLADGLRAAARMTFSGVHRGPLLGLEPTGRPVSYAGAAFFTIRDSRIAELWVLGDLDGLRAQLRS